MRVFPERPGNNLGHRDIPKGKAVPLVPGASESAFSSNVRELMHSYKKKGKIGKSRPKNKKKALKQALAISYAEKRRTK